MPGFPDTLKISVPPAVKLAAAICARPTLDPDIIAAEGVEDLQAALAQFAAVTAAKQRPGFPMATDLKH